MKVFKKAFSIFCNIIFFSLFGSGFIISILDMIPNFTFFQEFVDTFSTNLLLLMFCSSGLVILMDKVSSESNQTLLKEISEIVKEDKGKIVLLEGDISIHSYFGEKIKKLKKESKIYITAFDKYNSDYDTTNGKISAVDEFMRNWKEYVVKRNISVEQLVHICDEHDYNQLMKRIESVKLSSNFTISAYLGLPSIPYIDLAIIDDEITILFFPDKQSNPYYGDFGIAIENREITRKFKDYFMLYNNSELCKIVYTENMTEQHKKNLKDMEKYLMRTRPDFSKISIINKYITSIFSKNEFLSIIEEISDIIALLNNDITNKFINNLIDEYKKVNNNIKNKYEILIPYNESIKILNQIFSCENLKIMAVSDDTKNKEFWDTEYGLKIREMNIKKELKNYIHRIHIVSDVKEKKKKNKTSFLTEQWILSTDVDNIKIPIEDFLIVNKSLLFIYKENGDSILSIDKNKINDYIIKYNKIRNKLERK